MKPEKRKMLEEAGWAVSSASDFLELSKAEETIVAMKLALADKVRILRKKQHLTQQELAKRIGSSQSRVAKMETADQSVSIELFVRSLVSLGTSQTQIGQVISSSGGKETEIPPTKTKKRQLARS